MKIEEFVKSNGSYGKDKKKDSELKKELEMKFYIPIGDKINIVNSMADTLIVKNEEGYATYDGIARYIIFTTTVIKLYTNLEFDIESLTAVDNKIELTHLCEQYDLLMENGWLFPILEMIGEDYKDFNSLLNMKWEERMNQLNSSEATINRVMGAMLNAIETASAKVAGTVLNDNTDYFSQLLQATTDKKSKSK
jgi:hypothetical protein